MDFGLFARKRLQREDAVAAIASHFSADFRIIGHHEQPKTAQDAPPAVPPGPGDTLPGILGVAGRTGQAQRRGWDIDGRATAAAAAAAGGFIRFVAGAVCQGSCPYGGCHLVAVEITVRLERGFRPRGEDEHHAGSSSKYRCFWRRTSRRRRSQEQWPRPPIHGGRFGRPTFAR